MPNAKSTLIALWIVGAAGIAAGVFLDWMEISVEFADGTRRTITASGLDLYTEYNGTGMPVSSSTPVLYLLMAVAVASLALIHWRRGSEEPPVDLAFAMLVILAAMLLTGHMAVDNTIMCAEPPAGADVHGIPGWLADIAPGDVHRAAMSSSYGYMVSITGQMMSSAAALLYVKRSGAS